MKKRGVGGIWRYDQQVRRSWKYWLEITSEGRLEGGGCVVMGTKMMGEER